MQKRAQHVHCATIPTDLIDTCESCVAVYKIEDSHSMCAFWVSRRLHMLRFCSFYFLLYAFLRLLRTFYVRLCLHSYLHILLGLHTSLQLCTSCKHFVCSACGRTLHCLCCVLHTDTFLGWKLVLIKKFGENGQIANTVVSPMAWNALPDDFRDPSLSADNFRKTLKTHLFWNALGLLTH